MVVTIGNFICSPASSMVVTVTMHGLQACTSPSL